MKRTTIDFGIDLGTTNSTIAVVHGADAKVVPNKSGSGITPSAVWIDKRGSLHVGQEAKLRALIDDAENGDVEFKLRMGDGEVARRVFARSGRGFLPEELSAEVLKSLKADVQTSMGEDVRAAVITVPAAFEQPATAATKRAAALAGLSCCTLLLEPVAASLAYGFQSESENAYWFVYDFGGGTFDAAVMRIRDGLIQVVNHAGDNFLGGKLIDWDIVEKALVPALAQAHNLPDFNRGNPAWKIPLRKLKWYAEEAKIEVCRRRAPHELYVENLCVDADGKPVDFTYTLTPETVAEISRPWIEKSLGLCRTTLQHCGLKGSDMERIILVGGTTLNPWLREAVQAELGHNVEVGIDPVTVVARGAAIFASTQVPTGVEPVAVAPGTWAVQLVEHRPVGNVPDPDIGGRVTAPAGASVQGCTVELVDTKTGWRSGRIPLGGDGVFLAQLHAQKGQRHEYTVEVRDAAGARLTTSGNDVASYTWAMNLPEENPPAVWTIGVGLANGSVAPYVRKGAKLPARETLDHFTTIPLRRGQSDVLRIPLLEGEHERAERNHGIGALEIRGTDIKRDLPAGSEIEVTVFMDVSQQVRVEAYVKALDEEFEASFNSTRMQRSLDELRGEAEKQRKRLADVRQRVGAAAPQEAREGLAKIDDQQLVGQIESLTRAAGTEGEAVTALDRRVQELASVLDAVEDAQQLPAVVDKAEEALGEVTSRVESHGKPSDRARLDALRAALVKAKEARDADAVRRCTDDLHDLHLTILDRMPVFHMARFEWLVEKLSSMRDVAQAEKVIAQGRRAAANDDVEGIKAANRQLASLLPREIQEQEKHANVGSTMVRR